MTSTLGSRIVTILAFVLVLAWLGPPASAQGDLEAKARAHYTSGETLYRDGRYLEARAEFSAGYELSRRPLFLFNMAECSRLNQEPELARDYYRRYLHDDPDGPMVKLARERLAAIDKAAVVDRAVVKRPDLVLHDHSPETGTSISPPTRSRPIYKRPWFWGAISAAVIGGTVAVIAATRGGQGCDGCTVVDFTR